MLAYAASVAGNAISYVLVGVAYYFLPINHVIHPTYEEVVPKEVMPLPKEPSKRGNLRIKFNTKLPAKLIVEQKTDIKKLLAP